MRIAIVDASRFSQADCVDPTHKSPPKGSCKDKNAGEPIGLLSSCNEKIFTENLTTNGALLLPEVEHHSITLIGCYLKSAKSQISGSDLRVGIDP